MPHTRIDTKTAREKLTPRREPYWHKLMPGAHLGFRRGVTGGTWIVRYRPVDGQRQFESLGELNDLDPTEQFSHAQKKALEWIDALGVATSNRYTVKNAIDDYEKHLQVNNSARMARETKQRLYKHVIPELGEIRLTKLTLKQVTDWRDGMVSLSDDPEVTRKSKDTVNRVLSMFKAALNLAHSKDIVGTDKAWRRVQAFKDVGAARKVILTDEQIQRLFVKTSGAFHDLLKSALLTGARYEELTRACVADFDQKNGSLHLTGKTGTRDCYLSDESIRHFKTLSAHKLPSAPLHLKDDGTAWGKSHQRRPMDAACSVAKLPAGTTFYTLRHTHISRALLSGVNAQVIAENCGTSVRMIEKHYGKFLKADRRAMFNKVKIA